MADLVINLENLLDRVVEKAKKTKTSHQKDREYGHRKEKKKPKMLFKNW